MNGDGDSGQKVQDSQTGDQASTNLVSQINLTAMSAFLVHLCMTYFGL